ncbi:hypothetical protein ASPWEDRAFT_701596 [Aspergillus wentii DTO 134E9]|uniref:EthD domain-containing protein n=1 Tax=Aspergillus wentii DTO 134E9 TaxID=1073089 RepID=A0A1L9R5N0_ASPWE|nr:uncharacterized protein ASPWEDRAFT_701596 [Aspergillus wentii DTO 134E9]OJJ30193.1 hypothetical protein ASPWEDRAFT_701596 [Aspergillus wentii DTO 134E9]
MALLSTPTHDYSTDHISQLLPSLPRLVQYHQPPQYRATKLWEYLGADSIANWDGHVQLYVPSLDCIGNALNDPFYKEVVIPDEDKFISAKSCMRTAGYEECFIMNNRVVETPPLFDWTSRSIKM